MAEKKLRVGILIFEGVEVLDFCGPFEVFATAIPSLNGGDNLFEAITIAETTEPVKATGGLIVLPHYSIAEHPALDILVVPGGWGTRNAVNREPLMEWIAAQGRGVQLATSVCTGAFLLAGVGLLDGKEATTHWASIERLRDAYPAVTVRDDQRVVDQGAVITSAGVSAGIDMALYVVGRLYGEEAAAATARRMEYDRRAVAV